VFLLSLFTHVGIAASMGSVASFCLRWNVGNASVLHVRIRLFIFRSTPLSQPNNMGRKMSIRTSVRPSTKTFFDFNDIWYVGRGR